ncbi:phosphatase [Paenibacillus arenosi]|uniref:phosphatase n=1 Tax=Paenibacillus arenosi TaxID=2774142 RepID=UPI001CDB6AEC|nr:phosphatase [Paenibacillus arenosi]
MPVQYKTAWASLSAAILVTVYYSWNLLALKGNITLHSSEMMSLARNVFGFTIIVQMLIIFIHFVSKDEPDLKERARFISLRSGRIALLFLIVAVASCAAYLIYVADTRSLLLSPLISAHLLVSVLLAAWIIRYTAELWMYHRARHLSVETPASPNDSNPFLT